MPTHARGAKETGGDWGSETASVNCRIPNALPRPLPHTHTPTGGCKTHVNDSARHNISFDTR